MGNRARIRQGMTLEEFLTSPEDKPYLEYIDGRIEAKGSWRMVQSVIALRLVERLNCWAKPMRRGLAFLVLRCTFSGRSIVPDVVFSLKEHIEIDESGEPVDETPLPPDIHIEIISPDRSVEKSRERLAHSTAHGCPLGWMIHPEKRMIDVYRPGRAAERMAPDGVLEGEPVLPGFRLPVAEVFGWLKLGR